mmetsp:Transcript_47990/g.114057  ORF Transcript_47990/g.114057 Transcript_47990/m.114057 type:complete len:1185 (-) Transcript_47990:90-3644(-)
MASDGELVQETSSNDKLVPIRGAENYNRSQQLGMAASAPSIGFYGRARKDRATRQKEFMTRQMNHSTVALRRSHAEIQRRICEESWAQDDMGFWGAKGVDGFKDYLVKKFGSILAGWRQLDEDKNGKLSFNEFCNACRRMGFHGNLKKLWKELDKDQGGFVSMYELDAETGSYLGQFKMALVKKYGDILTAWQKGLDINGNGRIEEAEIDDCLKRLGLELNSAKLYSMLKAQPGPNGLGLTLADFDPSAWNRWVTGDFKGLTLKSSNEWIEDVPDLGGDKAELGTLINAHRRTSGGARQFRQEQFERDRAETKAAIDKIYKFRAGLHNVEGFKEALRSRCGSCLGAWRQFLDLDGRGFITFGEFSCALSRLAFHGHVRSLWKQLDRDSDGRVSLADLDEETHSLLTEFNAKLKEKYGNMLVAWLKAMDTQGTGLVNEQQFTKACENIGYSGNPKKLFKILQPDIARKFLTLKDFDTQAFNALSRGDFRMISELDTSATHKVKLSEMSFEERQEAGFFYQIRRAWDAAKREEFAKACRTANVPEHFIDTTEEFESLLKRKFGSLVAAWRLCLDADLNGKLTPNEFAKVCRYLGYGGNIKALFAHYDEGRKGYINMSDLDPEAYTSISSFLGLLEDTYGDIDTAWRKGFGKDPHDSIDEQELAGACEALGYNGSARKLFKALQPMPGRNLITIWDLDPECSRKRQRGQKEKEQQSSMSSTLSVAKSRENASVPKDALTVHKRRTQGFGQRTAGESELGDLSQESVQTTSSEPRFTSETQPPAETLRAALRRKYGSTAAAWRTVLDPDLRGTVSFGKFRIVLDHCIFQGDVKALWQQLAGSNKGMSFRNLDPPAQKLLDLARRRWTETFGSLDAAWMKGIDQHGIGCINQDEFLHQAETLALSEKQLRKLFRLLLNRQTQKSLTKIDLQAVLIGVPPEEHEEVWHGPPEENADGSSPPNSPGRNFEPELSPRQRVENLWREHHKQDIVLGTLVGFKRMLKQRYGGMFAAWRHVLDEDHNGVVTRKDFANACRKFGVKAIQPLWDELDENKDGQISLYEMDHALGEAFETFERLLIEQFSSTKKGWQKFFDVKRSLQVDEAAFIEGCSSLGYPGDASQLFRWLQPESWRTYLTYQDVWLDLDPNDFEHTASHGNGVSVLSKSRTKSRGNLLEAEPSSPSNQTPSPQVD